MGVFTVFGSELSLPRRQAWHAHWPGQGQGAIGPIWARSKLIFRLQIWSLSQQIPILAYPPSLETPTPLIQTSYLRKKCSLEIFVLWNKVVHLECMGTDLSRNKSQQKFAFRTAIRVCPWILRLVTMESELRFKRRIVMDELRSKRKWLVTMERNELRSKRKWLVTMQRDELHSKRKRLVTMERDELHSKRKWLVTMERNELRSKRKRLVTMERDELHSKRKRLVTMERGEAELLQPDGGGVTFVVERDVETVVVLELRVLVRVRLEQRVPADYRQRRQGHVIRVHCADQHVSGHLPETTATCIITIATCPNTPQKS